MNLTLKQPKKRGTTRSTKRTGTARRAGARPSGVRPATEKGDARSRRMIPAPKKSNTTVIVACAAGGFLLLIIIIAVAVSGGGDRQQEQVEQDTPRVTEKKSSGGMTVSDLGVIMFVCSNSPNHEDKEKIIYSCPSCGARNKFFASSSGFACFNCKAAFPESGMKCDECGRTPPVRRRHLKHK